MDEFKSFWLLNKPESKNIPCHSIITTDNVILAWQSFGMKLKFGSREKKLIYKKQATINSYKKQ